MVSGTAVLVPGRPVTDAGTEMTLVLSLTRATGAGGASVPDGSGWVVSAGNVIVPRELPVDTGNETKCGVTKLNPASGGAGGENTTSE